jgi:hypothetical protein
VSESKLQITDHPEPRCPLCGADARRVLYCGAPMKLCRAEECSCVFGWWEWVLRAFPWNVDGAWAFVPYERGDYWRALWAWLTGRVSP